MSNGQIFFLGGVHGVGKSTLAALCKESEVEHLRASDLIKQASSEARFDERKRVKDVDGNQGILVRSLNARIAGGGKFLLDGHFTLFNSVGEIEKIPLATFQAIQPLGLGVVVDAPEAIIARLQTRDKVGHDLVALKRMQEDEIRHAESVAQALGLELVTLRPGDVDQFRKWLQESLPE
ncbi:MAG TPA: ATP-binding protein [Elusimicrobiota bacterium]|nr:ATP-binding protein [Elusimicrobiota bacterium]